jgi:hypothetical protein
MTGRRARARLCDEWCDLAWPAGPGAEALDDLGAFEQHGHFAHARFQIRPVDLRLATPKDLARVIEIAWPLGDDLCGMALFPLLEAAQSLRSGSEIGRSRCHYLILAESRWHVAETAGPTTKGEGYNSTMTHSGVPGAELVEQGLADLRAGRDTTLALLVAIGAPRLRQLGFDVPAGPDQPEHRLYERLSRECGDAAHGRYNALVRRLVSFERAWACAR